MKRQYWALLIPALFALLLMLPRLFDAHFGLLDDGVTILSARETAHNPLGAFVQGRDNGRFFPFYFFYYLTVWSLSGENPVAFYAVNLLVLAVCAALLARAALLRGASVWQAAATGSLFLLNIPVSSTFNTLSKAEVPQCLFLCAALAAGSVPATSVPRLLVTAGFLLAAILSKETSYAVVPASGAVLLTQLIRHGGWIAPWRSRQGLLFLSALSAAAISFAAWKLIQPGRPVSGAYAASYRVGVDRMVNTLWYIIFLGLRSWAYLVPLLLGAVLLWKRINEPTRTAFLEGLIWAAMFAGILTPWPGVFEYHLAPAAIGLSFAAGFSFQAAAEACRARGRPRWLGAAALTFSCLLLPMNVANLVADRRIQLLVDRVNYRLVEELSRLSKGSRVFFNMPQHEYLYEAQLYLQDLLGRKDLSINVFDYDHREAAQRAGSYYVVSCDTNEFLGVFVRGPLRDLESKPWNRMLNSFLAPPSEAQVAVRIQESTQREDFALQNALCAAGNWLAIPCDLSRPFHLSRKVAYGWTVYKVSRTPTEAPVPVLVRGEGVWEFHPTGGAVRILRFGKAGDVPLKADLDGDGRYEIGVYRPSDNSWRFDTDIDGHEDLVFRLDDMHSGDVPLVGDWDGNGTGTAGFFRPKDSTWHLHNCNCAGTADVIVANFGVPGAVPLTGRWNHSAQSSIGFYRPQTGEVYLRPALHSPQELVGFAMEGDGIPVEADWNGMGYDTLALARKGKWTLRQANSAAAPFGAPKVINMPGDGYLLAARWKRLPD
jgi:hypothetical protein